MSRILTIVVMAALVCLLGGAPVSAKQKKWKGKQIEQVMDDLQKLVNRTSDLKTGMQTLQELKDEVQAGTQGLGDEARAFLTEVLIPQVQELAASEMQQMQAFVENGDDAEVRETLICLVNHLEQAINEMLRTITKFEFQCADDPLDVELSISLAAAREAIQKAPALALYPVHRLFELLGNTPQQICQKLLCFMNTFTDAAEVFEIDQEDRGQIVDAAERAYKVASAVKERRKHNKTAEILKVHGTLLESIEQKLIVSKDASGADPQVAIWGWVGAKISVDTQARIATLIGLAGRLMKQYGGMLAKRIKRYVDEARHDELLEEVAASNG